MSFILINSNRYRESLPKNEPKTKGTYLVGLCTGQLVASAVACACVENVTDLIPLAVETVCTAFRLGLYVDDMASTLHLTSDHLESWATSFKGVSEEETHKLLDEFHESRVSIISTSASPFDGSYSIS